MATVVLGGIGLAVGSAFGQPQLGFSIGTMVGGMIDAKNQQPPNMGRLTDLRVTGSQYASPIPQVWGSYRLQGQIIWAKELAEKRHRHSAFFGLVKEPSTYTYSDSFAVLVCRGPRSIRRIWGEDRKIYDLYGDPPAVDLIRIYRGDETQVQDPLLATGDPLAPAYRGDCYVVFDTLQLADWGNRIPNLSFEITAVYPDLILSHPSNQLYYQFSTAMGNLVDSGLAGKSLTLAPTDAAAQRVTGCFQALNGSSGGGDGIWVPYTGVPVSTLQAFSQDAAFQSSIYTIETWFQWRGTTNGGAHLWYTDPQTRNWPFRLIISATLFSQLNIQLDTTPTISSSLDTIFSYTLPVADRLWHHVMATYNGSGTCFLYVDGVQVDAEPPPYASLAMSPAAGAQSIFEVVGQDFNLDEVAFYNAALTGTDALSHYNAGVSGSIPGVVTVGAVLADLFAQAGLSPSQYDVSAASDAIVGFALTDRQDVRSAIDGLLQTYDTFLTEVDGKIVAVKRGAAPVMTLPAGDLAARLEEGSESDPPPSLSVVRAPDIEQPFRLEFTYFSQYRNYMQAMQAGTRYTKSWLQNAEQMTVPVVLSDNDARAVAEKILYRRWLEREQPQFSLPPRYLALAAGDVVTLPVPGGTANVRLQQVDIALPGPLAVTAVLDDAAVLSQTVPGGVMVTPTEEPSDVTATTLVAWNGNALADADAGTTGLYLTAGPSQDGFWSSATVYVSNDGGSSYQELVTLSDPGTLGTAATALPAGTVAGDWDTVNTVDVTLISGTVPVSTSDADVIAGNNEALLGDEVIQFATVTPLGGKSYRLSRLLRGRRGTDAFWGLHAVGERFALIDTGIVERLELGTQYLGTALLLKPVGVGQAVTDVAAQTVPVTGAEARPYAPAAVTGSRDGSNNLTLNWIRRTRTGGGMPSPLTIPLGETVESYNVRVRAGVTKAITVITQASQAVVTATAHGFSVGNTVIFAGCKGMTRINGVVATITAVTTNTLTVNFSSLYLNAYTGGGTVEKVLRTIGTASPTASYTAAQQTADGLVPGNPVSVAVAQVGLYGDGYYTWATV